MRPSMVYDPVEVHWTYHHQPLARGQWDGGLRWLIGDYIHVANTGIGYGTVAATASALGPVISRWRPP